jgi:hypothetical protein
MFEYIEINDKKYPIIFNVFVIGELQRELGDEFAKIDEENYLSHHLYLYEPIIWHSLRVGHLVAKVPLEFTREDMPIILSDNKIYGRFEALKDKFLPDQNPDEKIVKKK